MSYECEVSFKTVPASKVFSFFRKMKEEIKKQEIIDALSTDLFYRNPIAQLTRTEIDEHIKKYADLTDFYNNRCDDPLVEDYFEWIRGLFRFRWFYLDKYKLLGIFGVPKALQHLFDNTTFFQSYSDQDYDWNTWKGVSEFEKIAVECMGMSEKDVEATEFYIEDDLEYGKRTYCYSRIYGEFVAPIFEDDDLPIYISLIDGISSAKERIRLFRETYRKWREWYQKEFAPVIKS